MTYFSGHLTGPFSTGGEEAMRKHREDVSATETCTGKAQWLFYPVFPILSNALMCTSLTMLILLTLTLHSLRFAEHLSILSGSGNLGWKYLGEKISESSKKQNFNLLHTTNRLHYT